MICGHAPQSGCSLEEKQSFYDKLKCKWDMHSADNLVICIDDFNGHVGRHIHGFGEVHGGCGVGLKNMPGRMLLELFLEKELCVSSTLPKREEKRKVTFGMGDIETEIDFVLMKKEH